ncbi:hypothetical protein IMZ31_05150 [Pontibacillus sp. ALD_SL1]|uniref:hypothetical protein n=1 Tax=Pontibacillus sp. ALD_SL1 TaxID=2777185 RepID=UPI001A9650D2|nr:hypothetical protein [Pontibacillus sp. ALD_SL1]QST00960.1 hypothetical protein IMZ31_05150 [Pontibacillus sp. ALD_SL1]
METATALWMIIVLAIAFIFRWLRILSKNSEAQIKQNEQLIEQMKQLNEQLKEQSAD